MTRLSGAELRAVGMERRMVPRVAARVPVTIEVRQRGEQYQIAGRTWDIGTGGMAVQTRSEIPLDGTHLARVDLGVQELEFEVEGRWQAGAADGSWSSGFAFKNLAPNIEFALWDFVNRRAMEIALFLHHATPLQVGPHAQDAMDLALFTRVAESTKGAMIVRQGECDAESHGLLIVRDGTVTLSARNAHGRVVQVGRLGPGGLFGGLPVVVGRPQVVTAVAEEDVVLLEIDPGAFLYLQQARPRSAQAILRAVVELHADLSARLIEALLEDPGHVDDLGLGPAQ